MADIKKMNIAEFREKGYLQELNRTFLHPLGLALEISIDSETGEETLSGIWDNREDPEGNYYDLSNSTDERKLRFRKNAEFIQREFDQRNPRRFEILNFFIEPVY